MIRRLIPHLRWGAALVGLVSVLGAAHFPLPTQAAEADGHVRYFPLAFVARRDNNAAACAAIPNAAYQTLSVNGPPTDRPAEQHADLNLALRGYQPNFAAFKGLVNYDGATDPNAPQLAGLLADQRTPTFVTVYRAYDWNWACNCRGELLTQWPVTVAGLGVGTGEIIHTPPSGYDIGQGYTALVLYASDARITLKYTREDNVVAGYTVHIDGICVEPTLLALYQTANAEGRHHLPALRGGQPLGRAYGGQIAVAIRDHGTFLDPRSRKDWWRGR